MCERVCERRAASLPVSPAILFPRSGCPENRVGAVSTINESAISRSRPSLPPARSPIRIYRLETRRASRGVRPREKRDHARDENRADRLFAARDRYVTLGTGARFRANYFRICVAVRPRRRSFEIETSPERSRVVSPVVERFSILGADWKEMLGFLASYRE